MKNAFYCSGRRYGRSKNYKLYKKMEKYDLVLNVVLNGLFLRLEEDYIFNRDKNQIELTFQPYNKSSFLVYGETV